MNMLYDSILARTFRKHEQKIFRYWAIIGCWVIALSFCTVLKPYLGPLSPLNLRESMGVGLKMLIVKDTSSFPFILKDNNSSQHMVDHQMVNVHCNITKRSDFCEIEDDIRFEANSGTVFISSSSSSQAADTMIRPYARKTDEIAMSRVRKWSVKSVKTPQELPKCTQNHSVPALLFSSGGYGGNHFHDFSDIIMLLYLTSRPFNGEVQFVVTDERLIWVKKFEMVLQKLTNYDIIDIDQERDKVHCFPGGIIGLKAHNQKDMIIDPSKSPYTMSDFRQFLRSCYSLQRSTAIRLKEGEKKRPQLLIISRKRTRILTNVDEVAGMAEKLGYEVVVAEANVGVRKFTGIVNSCDVLVGVHGAGLTNNLFLPENAVLIQVVPIGVEAAAREYYGEPSKAMKVRYLEYNIKAEESSLIQKYPIDHQVIRNPYPIPKLGWVAFKSLYLDTNVQLDLNRFRGTLLKALELLHE